MAERLLYFHQPSTPQTATFSTPDIPFDEDSLLVEVNVTAISGTPSMVVTVEGRDEDGAYFVLYTSGAITTVSKLAASIGEGMTNAAALPAHIRLTFTISGGTPSLTFTVSAYGGRVGQ